MASSTTNQHHQPWPLHPEPEPKPTTPSSTTSRDQDHHTILHIEHSFESSPPPTNTTTTPDTPPPPTNTNSPPKHSNILHLFTFTPPPHLPRLTLSLTTALLVAAGRTAYAVLLGSIFDVVSRFGAGALAPAAFLTELSQWAVWMCVLGVGVWVVSTVDVAAWVVGGEVRARGVRERLFAGFLHRRGVGWFEGRREGVGGLVVGVQT
jgi:ATP-binding cassette subfamily B (MDR/TAP) protein 1